MSSLPRTPGSRLGVLVADDHPLVRSALRTLIGAVPSFEVIGEAADGLEAVEFTRRHAPAVVVLDIGMPTLSGLDALPMIRRDAPFARVVVLSMHVAEATVTAAMRAGALGYVVKSAAADEIAAAIVAAAEGRTWISPQVAEHVREALARPAGPAEGDGPLAGLTLRQREVLRLIAEGLSTRDIAERLCISVKTVETHRSQLMDRLGIHDVASLTRLAIRCGLVSAER